MREQVFMSQCPKCGGIMVRSGNLMTKDKSFTFWGKPWQSWESTIVPVWSWACMSCGMVHFSLEKAENVKAEFQERVKTGEVKVSAKLMELVNRAKGGPAQRSAPQQQAQPAPKPAPAPAPAPVEEEEVEFEIE